MFCEKCGTKNNKGAKFCESCGNKLVSNVKEKINVSKVKKQSSNLFNKLKNCSKKIKIIGLAILLLIVVSIILLVSFFSNPTPRLTLGFEKFIYSATSMERTDDRVLQST